MAGHSQFKNIMHRKGAQDAKRARQILASTPTTPWGFPCLWPQYPEWIKIKNKKIENYQAVDQVLEDAARVLEQLLHAFGFCGAGFQTGPAVGELLAELVYHGRCDIELAPFALPVIRFIGGEPMKPATKVVAGRR